jgi:hypothetical protein
LTAFLLGFEERPFYSLNVPNDPREEGAFLEVWCDLMKAELKIARKEIAELRREGANERHWLYAESSLEECSASLLCFSAIESPPCSKTLSLVSIGRTGLAAAIAQYK